jgi:proline iminopeptidase
VTSENGLTEILVQIQGRTLWTVSAGVGQPVILCSGGPGCCDYLAPVAQLIDGAAQTIRFDPLGCGRSERGEEYSVDGCLAELEAIRHHYGLERWVVAGHSWGADLALIYALHYPQRVAGFVCLAGGRLNNDREWHKVYSAGRDQGLEAQLDFAYPPNLEVNAQVNQSVKRYIQRPTLWREVAHLERPALFVYGSRDIRPSWPVEQVAKLLPNGEFLLLHGADHYLWTSHALELGEVLNAFIHAVAPIV